MLQRRRRLQQDVELIASLRRRSDDLAVLFEWIAQGEDVAVEFTDGLEALGGEVESGGDQEDARRRARPPERHRDDPSGSGGTESQDWAEMLMRMYVRWAERRGLRLDVIDYQPGDEAGLKSVTFTLSGEYAYGLMSAEAGVHRLVRISPFDQAARRHTSFASVFVWPELPDDVQVEIEDKDLRIDTYRSSGAGGQHVNVTDSAVRITHLSDRHRRIVPERTSQHRNRDAAMKVLRSRLYDLRTRSSKPGSTSLAARRRTSRSAARFAATCFNPTSWSRTTARRLRLATSTASWTAIWTGSSRRTSCRERAGRWDRRRRMRTDAGAPACGAVEPVTVAGTTCPVPCRR